MKKHISLFLIATMILSVFMGFGSVALADGEDLDVRSSVSELAEGGSVDFTATINPGVSGLTDYKIVCGSTVCYDSDGAPLAPGEPKEVTFTMEVTNEMLGKKIKFTLTSDGSEVASDSVTIAKKELSVKMGASYTAQDLVPKGGTSKFVFKIENQGEAPLENIVVTAPELNDGQPLNAPFTLPATGDTDHEFSYKHTVTAEVTVHPVVKYSVGGVEQEPISLKATEITFEERHVEPVLTVDNKTPNAGEDVTLTLTITNEGNVSYTDMEITMKGEEKEFPSSRLKPGDEKSETYTMSFTTSEEVYFTITLKDHTGNTVSVDSNHINIELPVDPEKLESKLKLTMNVDRPQLTSAGRVNFTGFISNGSEYTLSDVSLDEKNKGNVLAVSSIGPGGRQDIDWGVDINETTTYEFVLTLKDRDGKTYTVNAEPVTVTIASVGPVETPSETPADVPGPQLTLAPKGGGIGTLGLWGIIAIVLVVLIIGVGIAMVVLWKKGQAPRKTTAAKMAATKKRPAAGRRPAKRKTTPKNYRDRNNF